MMMPTGKHCKSDGGIVWKMTVNIMYPFLCVS